MAASRLVSRYRLLEPIARGGMGEVWRAHDDHMERPVAIKVLRPDLEADPATVERFGREARLASLVTHPNVAAVLDIIGEPPAIVFELVEGETLAERLRWGPLPLPDALRCADDLLAALEATHAAGIVHRDITPANVLLTADGRAKVADFGIARDDDAARLTDTGTVVGTASYLSPEQLEDRPPDPASDQYAAGLVIYEALSARRPFEAANPAASALSRLTSPPTPLQALAPAVPDAVAAVVMRALARFPGDRHASVRAMREALVAAVAGEPEPTLRLGLLPLPQTAVLAAPAGPGSPRRGRARAASRLLAVAAIAFALALGAAALTSADRGPGATAVPDVVGRAFSDATRLLKAEGLRADVTMVESDQAEGTVLTQDVAPGTRVVDATTVRLEMSSGAPLCCSVPDVVGLALGDAAALLSEAGLTLGSVELVESDADEGTVVAQGLSPGSPAAPDAAMAVEVSSGNDEGDDHKGRGKGVRDDD
ncbi:MAG: protein kinase [Actinobacteria bacterium]|nr:protein kinase [Actinomycetota bacterium]